MKTKDFYKGVGVATKTVSYWENGHNPITLSKIPLIATTLNVPIYKLFVFLDVEEDVADKDYIELLQMKTSKELEVLFNLVKELQKIK